MSKRQEQLWCGKRLRELGLCSLDGEEAQGELSAVNKYPVRRNEEGGATRECSVTGQEVTGTN